MLSRKPRVCCNQLHQREIRLLCNLLPKDTAARLQIDLPGSCVAGAETLISRPSLTSTPPIL